LQNTELQILNRFKISNAELGFNLRLPKIFFNSPERELLFSKPPIYENQT